MVAKMVAKIYDILAKSLKQHPQCLDQPRATQHTRREQRQCNRFCNRFHFTTFIVEFSLIYFLIASSVIWLRPDFEGLQLLPQHQTAHCLGVQVQELCGTSYRVDR